MLCRNSILTMSTVLLHWQKMVIVRTKRFFKWPSNKNKTYSFQSRHLLAFQDTKKTFHPNSEKWFKMTVQTVDNVSYILVNDRPYYWVKELLGVRFRWWNILRFGGDYVIQFFITLNSQTMNKNTVQHLSQAFCHPLSSLVYMTHIHMYMSHTYR